MNHGDLPPERCDWEMPTNSRIMPGAQCVQDADHDDGHVIASPTRSAVTYYRITDESERLAKTAVHVDLRDGQTFDDEECRAMWVYMQLVARPD